MIEQNFVIDSRYNKINGIMIIPGEGRRYPCAILSHGLLSSKESSKYMALSGSFAEAGIASCRFDYHGCGESGGNIEETTLSIRLDNLKVVFDHVLDHPSIDPRKIGIIGSSFGGSTGLLKAARDERVKCLSLWATPHILENKEDETIADIKFKPTIYTDFNSYDLLEEARKVQRTLVIHGDSDEVVPCIEGKTIYKFLKKPKAIEIIKGGDHILSVDAHRTKAINLTLNWFRRYLISDGE
ncbi:MAG: prolyl oligopeptidase family serine peptidase [Syntrophorhabdaceae bacterium]|nr:prolyl oligopeptidase family serine peptidase [Syntrophorhabdaceae bacterium]MDD4194894.1 prolyl oligopeptidase family serine peptidase [Syntrophorhabdaceae bacterium]